MKRVKKFVALLTVGLVVASGAVRADPSPSGGGVLKPKLCATCSNVAPEPPKKP
jgi:hypothetical protein